MGIIKIEKAGKNFSLGKTIIHALKGVSLEIGKGEFMAIVGPSGSGKSTLLNLIGCIERPSSGTVMIDGTDIGSLSPDELAEIRSSRLGFIFQSFNLLPVLTVAENVEYPLHLGGGEKRTRAEKVAGVLKEVGLERFSSHKPAELSGGQRQRVAIARALVGSPSIILADEPTANLDHRTGEEILNLMKDINRKMGATFVFSTHDPKIMNIADRMVELRDGEITFDHVS
ncbi:sulfonate transport system ATP-binding protein [uncultured bacterium]|nr:sulfonate transport system ATP-binding protein [uncultured bacterium]